MPALTRTAAAALVALAAAGASTAPADAAAKRCANVKDPYAGTRYEGIDLSRIRADGVSCTTARKVAKGAHRKALGMTPTGPTRRFSWKGWKVTGDLTGDSDRYTARRNGDVVRWRF